MEFLKSAVASAISKGPLGAYSIAERVDLESSIWTLNNCKKREGNVNCSIFTFDVAANKGRLPLARNAFRKSRTLRHPGLVTVLDSIETETQLYIITERVVPLTWYLKRNSMTAETKKWGLWSISKTVKFINEEAASIHGLVRSTSVFTSEAGEWKLAGLEILSSVKDDEAVIYSHTSLVPDSGRFLPPEVLKGGWDTVKRNPITSIDSYGFGALTYETFNGTFTGSDQAGQPKRIPPTMQQTYKRLMNPNPKARLSVSHFLDQGCRENGFFQTPLIHLSEGIESLGLKSETERDVFLNDLQDSVEDFPEDYLKLKVLPEMLKSVEFGGGGPKVFTLVLKIGTKLSEDEYEVQMTPVLVRLFSSPDRAIRVCLLDNLPLMIDHLSTKIVNDKIFPNIVTGFTDIAPLVREQTVKSVLTIITKLSDRTINGELLKYLAKTANDEQPGIRTNTTICLGKIARNLSQNTRTKVLVAAFTRSLRDPFVHSRNAALLALAATADLFSEDDCASKILPAICPSLLDKEKLVRDQANKTLDVFLSRVRRHAQSMPEASRPPSPNTANGTSSAPRMGTPANDSSWAGWAISSFTNKLSAANGQIEPKTNGAAPPPLRPTPTIPVARSNPMKLGMNAPSGVQSRGDLVSPGAGNSVDDNVDEDNDNVGDGWGGWDDRDMNEADVDAKDAEDAWGLNDEDDEYVDAPGTATSRTRSGTNSISSTANMTPTIRTTNYEDAGEPDFAGWLQAQSSTKSKGPLPKGLGKPAAATAARKAAASIPSKPRPVTKTPLSTTSTIAAKPAAKMAAKPAKKTVDEDPEGWGDEWD